MRSEVSFLEVDEMVCFHNVHDCAADGVTFFEQSAVSCVGEECADVPRGISAFTKIRSCHCLLR